MHAQPLLNPTRPYSAPLGPTLSHLALPVSEYFYFKRIQKRPQCMPNPFSTPPDPLGLTRPYSVPLGASCQ